MGVLVLLLSQQFSGQFSKLFCLSFLQICMKRDGLKLAHNTLEKMRVLAVQRMSEGEHPDVVAASLGMNRSWAYSAGPRPEDAGVASEPCARVKAQDQGFRI